jgi:hypothetical protein
MRSWSRPSEFCLALELSFITFRENRARLLQSPVAVISILTSSVGNFYIADMEIINILITKIRKFFTLLAWE